MCGGGGGDRIGRHGHYSHGLHDILAQVIHEWGRDKDWLESIRSTLPFLGTRFELAVRFDVLLLLYFIIRRDEDPLRLGRRSWMFLGTSGVAEDSSSWR